MSTSDPAPVIAGSAYLNRPPRTLAEAMAARRRPLFQPCATCPDEDWCGANDCWWNADQGEP